jgi:hypothetical protein
VDGESGTRLVVPRGTPGLKPIELEMAEIYEAERRIGEVKTASPGNSQELIGTFSEACHLTSKYLGWVEYEILQAEKALGEAKAEVVIDKIPAAAGKLKEAGIKMSEDVREAFIARDPACSERLNILNGLRAVKKLLEGKYKTFERSYFASGRQSDRKGQSPVPNLNGYVGMTLDPQKNFMGSNETAIDQTVLDALKDG